MSASPGRPVVLGEDAPLFEIMATTRAMRRLAPDPVPDHLLQRLVEAATWGPSGGNGQGCRFVVVTDRDTMARLADLWRVAVDWYLDTLGGVTPRTMSDAAYARMVAAIRHQRDDFAATPALFVPCYDMRVMWDPARRAGPGGVLRRTLALGPRRVLRMAANTRILGDGAAASVYPGVQNLLLAARGLGLAATLTIWHLGLEAEFKQVLGIPRHVRTYGVIPVGRPLGRMGPVTRPPAPESMHRDRWGGRWEPAEIPSATGAADVRSRRRDDPANP